MLMDLIPSLLSAAPPPLPIKVHVEYVTMGLDICSTVIPCWPQSLHSTVLSSVSRRSKGWSSWDRSSPTLRVLDQVFTALGAQQAGDTPALSGAVIKVASLLPSLMSVVSYESALAHTVLALLAMDGHPDRAHMHMRAARHTLTLLMGETAFYDLVPVEADGHSTISVMGNIVLGLASGLGGKSDGQELIRSALQESSSWHARLDDRIIAHFLTRAQDAQASAQPHRAGVALIIASAFGATCSFDLTRWNPHSLHQAILPRHSRTLLDILNCPSSAPPLPPTSSLSDLPPRPTHDVVLETAWLLMSGDMSAASDMADTLLTQVETAVSSLYTLPIVASATYSTTICSSSPIILAMYSKHLALSTWISLHTPSPLARASLQARLSSLLASLSSFRTNTALYVLLHLDKLHQQP